MKKRLTNLKKVSVWLICLTAVLFVTACSKSPITDSTNDPDSNKETTTVINEVVEYDESEGSIALEDPKKVIEFKDATLEALVRTYYGLDEGEIVWEEIGNQTMLDLEGLTAEGTIKSFEDLKWFTNLEFLFLGGLDTSGQLKDLSTLKKLKQLELQETGVLGEIGDLSSLSLELLDLSDTAITGDISDLTGSKNLTYLNLNNTQVQGDLGVLNTLQGLKRISMVGTGVTGDISALSPLIQLEILELGGGATITGQLKDVIQMVHLSDLSIGRTDIVGDISELRDLTALNHINISTTEITGDIGTLTTLVNLLRISADYSKATGELTLPSGETVKVVN